MSGEMFLRVHSVNCKNRHSGGECISKAFIDKRGRALTGTKGKAMWYHRQCSEHYPQQKNNVVH